MEVHCPMERNRQRTGGNAGAVDRRRLEPTGRTAAIDSLEADGVWCPMAHCNRNDDSFQNIVPLRSVRITHKLNDPAVSPSALNNLGAFTGERMALCVYESPSHPALVAYDYQDGSVRWTSPPEDMPGFSRRRTNGILLAKMRLNRGPVHHYVFAANSAEFVAYSADGTRLWKQPTTEMAHIAPRGIGAPRSLRFSDAKELVAATNRGWVIKLNPLDGTVTDAYKMETSVVVQGRHYRGTLYSIKSPVVIGNALYLVVQFKAHPADLLLPRLSPVYIVRIELNRPGVRGPGTTIKPLARLEHRLDHAPDRVFIGVNKSGGSPPAWAAPDGKVLIFAHANTFMKGQLKPVITAVEDDGEVLRTRWRSVLDTMPGDDVYAAPAFHAGSRTLLVTTADHIYVFRNADTLTGNIPSPPPLSGSGLLALRQDRQVSRVGMGSPFALTFDPEMNEIVVYTNFRVLPLFGYRVYGFLGAFTLPIQTRRAPRALWCCPLAVDMHGEPTPGPGTFGQPALFRYESRGGQATGLIVNTVFTGTYIFK